MISHNPIPSLIYAVSKFYLLTYNIYGFFSFYVNHRCSYTVSEVLRNAHSIVQQTQSLGKSVASEEVLLHIVKYKVYMCFYTVLMCALRRY